MVLHAFLRILFILKLFSLMIQPVRGWTEAEDVRTGRVVMITGVNYTAVQGKISYNISYSSALAIGPTANAGLGITGLDTLVTTDLAVNLTIQNYTDAQMRISAEVFGDTICTHLATNYIAVGYGAIEFCEVIFQCYIMAVLNSGTQNRTESRTQNTYLAALNLDVTTHLSGFSLHNSQGINNYLAVTADIPTGTSDINYVFKTAENNTVTHVCITTIVFCQSCTQIQYFYWGVSSRGQISNSTMPEATFNPPGRFEDVDRMFYGISALNLSRAFNRSFDLDTTQQANLDNNYVSNYGVYSLMMDYFWIAKRGCNISDPSADWFQVSDQTCIQRNTCPNNTDTDQPLGFCTANCYYWCQTCTGSMPNNCSTCDTVKFRVLNAGTGECDCHDGYVDIGEDYRQQLCYACEYFIPGCDTCQTTSVCLTCLSGFVIDNDAKCACTSGYLVSGVCTNITGCTSAIENSGTVFCLACNQTLHFQRTNSTYSCQCSSAYYLSTNQTCDGKCGDALQADGQGCDDGNLMNGDGCSAKCAVEDHYQCFNGSVNSSSVCLISDGFSLTVKYVRRVLTGNIMQVGILVEPQYANLTEVNFKKYLTHNIPVSDYNVTYENGLMILYFEYTETIQGQSFDISMQLDPNIFYNANVSVTIPASGMNAKLTYDSANDTNFPLEIIVIILDVLALVVLLASAGFSERMIGIQCVQVLQSVLFLQTAMPTTPSTLAPLQQLRYSSGYNQVFGTDYSRTFTFTFSLSSIGLQKQFFLSLNLMLCILIGVIIAALIAKIVQKRMVKSIQQAIFQQDQQKYTQKYVKWTKIFNFIFERLVFVFGFLIMFLSVFAIMIQGTDMSGDYSLISKEFNLLIGAVSVGIVGGLVGLVCITSIFPQTKLFPIWTKQWYPMMYFLYQTVFIVLIAFIYTQFYILYIMIVLTIGFMVANIVYRPYFQKKHNVALIFNQAVVLAAEGVYLYEYLVREQNETFYKIMAWVLTGALYVVVAVSIYRIWTYRKLIEQLREQGYANFWDEPQQKPLNQYSNLKTPRTTKRNDSPSKIKQKKPQQKKPPAETQMNEIKNRQRKVSKISKAKKQDPENLDWNYNSLADNNKSNGNNTSRMPVSHREEVPDTDRNKQLNRSDTKKILQNDPYKNEKNLKNNYADEDEDYADEMYDDYGKSPYNEYGYQKQKPTDDPLALIKRNLRSDFNAKMNGSPTMKQL